MQHTCACSIFVAAGKVPARHIRSRPAADTVQPVVTARVLACGEQVDGEAEKSPKQEKDKLLTAVLLEDVLPKAVTLYMSGPLQVGKQPELKTLAPQSLSCCIITALSIQ